VTEYEPKILSDVEVEELKLLSQENDWATDWTSAKGTLDLIATIEHWRKLAKGAGYYGD
jgi:hypothetical protein